MVRNLWERQVNWNRARHNGRKKAPVDVTHLVRTEFSASRGLSDVRVYAIMGLTVRQLLC